MCEFISWIEYRGKILFLTDKDLASRRGKELQKFEPDPDEWKGHGSIIWFYGLEGKKFQKRECTDFSTPDSFPREIQDAIKSGAFTNFGVCPEALTFEIRQEFNRIVEPAWQEFNRIVKPARQEYDRIETAAWREYDRVRTAARQEYDRIVGPAWQEYDRIETAALQEYDWIVKPALQEYDWIVKPARQEYNRIETAARQEYDWIVKPARQEFDRICKKSFWQLFANPENRTEVWR